MPCHWVYSWWRWVADAYMQRADIADIPDIADIALGLVYSWRWVADAYMQLGRGKPNHDPASVGVEISSS